MFSIEEKFEYFLKFERQIIAIVQFNYQHSEDKILRKIEQLVKEQNKSYLFRFEVEDLSGSLKLVLKEINRSLFSTIIPYRAISRKIKINNILNP